MDDEVEENEVVRLAKIVLHISTEEMWITVEIKLGAFQGHRDLSSS